jgi:hypothetical protein
MLFTFYVNLKLENVFIQNNNLKLPGLIHWQLQDLSEPSSNTIDMFYHEYLIKELIKDEKYQY